MKVTNMTGRTGKSVPNQFIIEGANITVNIGTEDSPKWERLHGAMFQSYSSNICFIPVIGATQKTLLDLQYWDYSTTTGKYRNQFLGESKAETQRKIDSGEYILTDLN